MAPRKPKGLQEQPTAISSVRVTRATTKRAAKDSVSVSAAAELPEKKTKKPKLAGKGKPKEGRAEKPEAGSASAAGGSKRTIVIEHCKQCNSFKTRANQVKEGLEKSVAGILVILNPEKPRRGCFEIREEGGEKFISLLDMKRPFTPMKQLDMEKVIADIIDKINDN